MLAKKTIKNQLTLPKAVFNDVADSEYYQVNTEDGRIVLTPVRFQTAHAVRKKVAELGISTSDVADAVKWSRKTRKAH